MLESLHLLLHPALRKPENYSPVVALVLLAVMVFGTGAAYLYERSLYLAAEQISGVVTELGSSTDPRYKRYFDATIVYTDSLGATRSVVKRYDQAGLRRGISIGKNVQLLFNPNYPGGSFQSDTWDGAWGITSTMSIGAGIALFVLIVCISVRTFAMSRPRSPS